MHWRPSILYGQISTLENVTVANTTPVELEKVRVFALPSTRLVSPGIVMPRIIKGGAVPLPLTEAPSPVIALRRAELLDALSLIGDAYDFDEANVTSW